MIRVIYRYLYHHLSIRTLITLYTELVLPFLTYCSTVWAPSSFSCNSKSLERVQHFALRLCTSVGLLTTPCSSPLSSSLLFQTDVCTQPKSFYFSRFGINTFFFVVNVIQPALISHIFSPLPSIKCLNSIFSYLSCAIFFCSLFYSTVELSSTLHWLLFLSSVLQTFNHQLSLTKIHVLELYHIASHSFINSVCNS